jgi:hypothetical protein
MGSICNEYDFGIKKEKAKQTGIDLHFIKKGTFLR